uniref:Uncharacterized protein n=1 Tax=Rhizophora mucronata TaxID=61149 RepID=A0A2P2LV46_RHIMU
MKHNVLKNLYCIYTIQTYWCKCPQDCLFTVLSQCFKSVLLISFLLYSVVGAIELSILADYYGREIAAYDIQTTRCDLYGQVSNTRMFYNVIG